MKMRWQKLSIWLIGLLGFGSCDKVASVIDHPDIFDEPCMYGTPSAEYVYKVTVTDEEGKPIQGIQVTPLENRYSAAKPIATDAKGTAEGRVRVFPEQFNLALEDIDGEENGGQFVADTISFKEFNFKQVGKADDAWFDGVFEGTVTRVLHKSK